MTDTINKKKLLRTHRATRALMIVLVLIAIAYGFGVVFGLTPAGWPQFFTALFFLNVFNLIYLAAAWQVREQLSFNTQLATLLWAGLSLWYWSFAPVYYFLNMNVNQLQLAWVEFAYLWELPVIGGGLFLLVGYAIAKPIRRYASGETTPENPQRLYRYSMKYPVYISWLIWVVGTIGYGLGALQLWYFADLPGVELVKNIMNGVAVSVFIGVIFYLLMDAFIGPLRQRLQSTFYIEKPTPRNMSRRVTIIFTLTILGSIALISLVVVKAYQLSITEQVRRSMEKDMQLVVQEVQTQTGVSIINEAQTLKESDNSEVFVLHENDNLEGFGIGSEALTELRNGSNTVVDWYQHSRVIGLLQLPEASRQVLVISPVSDFYSLFTRPAVLFTLGILFVAAFTVGLVSIISYFIASTIAGLINKVRASKDSTSVGIFVNTGDEIEELAKVLSFYMQQSRVSQDKLKHKVELRTKELEARLSELEKLNKAMVGRELKMVELKKQLKQAKSDKPDKDSDSSQ